MAKSLRSKSKRSFRAKKRESGKYAAADAARLDRLHSKLAVVKDRARPPEGDDDTAEDLMVEEEDQGATVSDTVQDGEAMVLDEPGSGKRPTSVSTHGSRNSRREEWRKSKGMVPVPKRRGINRQGGLTARRKAGRPLRRR